METRVCLWRISLVGFAAIISLFLSLSGQPPRVQAQGGAVPAISMPRVAPGAFRGDVRHLPPVPSLPKTVFPLRAPVNSNNPSTFRAPASPNIMLAPMPGPLVNFAGMSFNDTCTGGQCGGGWPPDTNGDVGLNHYIEAVNDAYAIYDKTGILLASFTENSLFSGPQGGSSVSPCDTNSAGDPIVLYDPMADRWILSNFVFGATNNYQCIAVSMTSDPVAGGWWLYAFRMDPGGSGLPPVGTFNDYPKFGVWPDCIYYSANGFSGNNYVGAEFASFSRSDLEKGASVNWQLGFISTISDPFTMIPSNVRGNTPGSIPPANTPNYFVSESGSSFAFEVRKFTAGPNCSGSGILSTATNVSQTSYTRPGGNIVPQPNTNNRLDSIDDRLMQKVQYRRVGSTESLWVTHNVLSGGSASNTAPQWAQIDVSSGTIATTPVQQQIYAPDASLYRWMGSIAADNAGNAALGYSTSNGTSPNFPSIQYSGRLVGDPLNQLPQSEIALVAGAGSQTNNCGGPPCHRWGDYTAMSVDPSDDCTFWYTNEYYSNQANGTSGNWQTRIGAFSFPQPTNCTPSPVSATPHTIIFDGGVGSSWKLVTESLGTMPTTGTTFDYYATWDAANLYLGIKGSAEGNYTYAAVVDRDVTNETATNTGSAAALACAAGFNPNGKGDWALVRTGGTQASTGSTSKQQGTSGIWTAWSPSASTDAKDWGRNMAEFQFSWADLGTPPPNSPVGLYLYVCSGANLISSWPPEDLQSASPTLNVVTLFSTNGTGETPRFQGKHKKDQTITVTNGVGPFSALNGYVQLANVSGLGGNCSFNASVFGNADFNDPQIIHRQYTLTPGAGCLNLQADLTLKYEDGTMPNNAPSELGGLAENTLHVLRRDGNTWTDLGGTVNTGANTAAVTGITQFSIWTLGNGSHPTAVRLSSFAAQEEQAPNSLKWILASTGIIFLAALGIITVVRKTGA